MEHWLLKLYDISSYFLVISIEIYLLKIISFYGYNVIYLQAVFKNYDHDKDGFICNAEFEAIAGNFPFIDSFCVLDADK